MKIIDISLPLNEEIPVWPGSPGFGLYRYKRLEAGDECNSSRMTCDVHTGTHIDAPSHFIINGQTVEELPVDVLIGPAVVSHLLDVDDVDADALNSLALPVDTKRLLLRTRNSECWRTGSKEFRQDFVGLTSDASDWVVERGIQLIGIDYLSIASFKDMRETHRLLLEAGVILLEGINLYGVSACEYELICLPLKLTGAEGAPTRAVLRTLD